MFGRDAKVSEMCSEQVAGVSIHRYYLPIPRNKVLRGVIRQQPTHAPILYASDMQAVSRCPACDITRTSGQKAVSFAAANDTAAHRIPDTRSIIHLKSPSQSHLLPVPALAAVVSAQSSMSDTAARYAAAMQREIPEESAPKFA